MNKILILLTALSSLNASAADKNKIYCVFEDNTTRLTSQSGYVTQYVLQGVISPKEAMMGMKRTEYGVAKIGGKYVVDRSNVMNKNMIDIPYRKFEVSPKNNNPNWKTYVIKNAVGDGYIAAASLTLSNIKVSAVNSGNSYKAVFSMTTLGDDSNYTAKTPGLCSIEVAN